jgi:hypothetical protein
MSNIHLKKKIIIYILKIITLHNAVMLGWSVKKINNNTYELTKTMNNNSINIKDFIEKIIINNLF